jgi:hypothetical protein
MSDTAEFFITFRQASGHRNRFARCTAGSKGEAQAWAERHWADDYSMIYSAAEFDGQAERFGLTEVSS